MWLPAPRGYFPTSFFAWVIAALTPDFCRIALTFSRFVLESWRIDPRYAPCSAICFRRAAETGFLRREAFAVWLLRPGFLAPCFLLGRPTPCSRRSGAHAEEMLEPLFQPGNFFLERSFEIGHSGPPYSLGVYMDGHERFITTQLLRPRDTLPTSPATRKSRRTRFGESRSRVTGTTWANLRCD